MNYKLSKHSFFIVILSIFLIVGVIAPTTYLLISSSGDFPYFNQTEGTNLGARLSAAILSMDFNTDGESYPNLNYTNRSLYEQGTYIKDGSVYNNYGTSSGLTSPFWWTNNIPNYGKINGSLQFDNTNDYITSSTAAASMPLGDSNRTICAWVNPVGIGQTLGGIVSYGTTGSQWTMGLNTGKPLVQLTGSTSVTATNAIQTNTWTHLCSLYNGTDVIIYVNGTSVKNQTIAVATSGTTFNIGTYMGQTGSTYIFNGSIDDVIIWGRALNATEINQTYQEGLAGRTVMNFTDLSLDNSTRVIPSDSRVSYFDFNTNETGSTVTDLWSGTNNLSCKGTATWTQCALWNATGGVYNSAAYKHYNGGDSNKYLGTSNSNSLNNTPGVTIASWVKIPQYWSGGEVIAYTSGTDSWGMRFVSPGKFAMTYKFSEVQASSAPDYSKWHFVVGTLNDTGSTITVKLYVDGIYQGSLTDNSAYIKQDANFTVGQGLYQGYIDELMLFNRSLTDSEISNMYNQQVAHYTLDELNGTTAGTSSVSPSGTLTNYPTTATTAPVYNATGGVSGSGAYVFDGVDDRITTQSGSTLLEGSVNVWFKSNYILPNGVSGVIFSKVGNPAYATDSAGFYLFGSGVAPTTNPQPIFYVRYQNNNRVYWVGPKMNLTNNEWHMFSYVTSNSLGNRIYIDGIEINANGTYTGSSNTTRAFMGDTASNSYFTIGDIVSINVHTYFFNGSVDNFFVTPEILTQDRITELYNSGNGFSNPKYVQSKQGDFTTGVFYNSTSTYWNVSLSTADTTSRSGIVNPDNSINLSNPNLVSYWALDGNYLDATGRNNGTGIGGLNNATGISSNAIRFDGGVSYINITSNPSLTNNYTTSFWFVSGTNANQGLFAPAGTMARGIYYNGNVGACHPNGNNGANAVIVRVSDGTYLCSEQLTNNVWHHAVVSSNSSGTWLYVDGTLRNNNTKQVQTMTSNLWLGISGLAGQSINGTLDEFLLYNRSLSYSEVSQLYKGGLSQHANTNVTIQTRTANSYNVSDPSLRAFYTFQNENLTIIPVNDTSRTWYVGTAPTSYNDIDTYFSGTLWHQVAGASNHIYQNYTAIFTGGTYTYINTYTGVVGNINISIQTDNGYINSSINENTLANQWRFLGVYNFTKGNTYLIDFKSAAANAIRVQGSALSATNLSLGNALTDETGKSGYNFTGDMDENINFAMINRGSDFNSQHWVVLNDTLGLGGSTAVTYAGWINPRITTAGGYRPLIECNGVAGYNHLTINNVNAGSLRLFVNGVGIESGANVLTANKWQHIAGTWNNVDNQSRLYVNGVQVYNASIAQSFLNLSGATCFIGNSPILTSRVLKGFADEIRVYNRSLSDSEILDLYNLGSTHINWNNGGSYSTQQTCYDNETQIQTESGWKLFSELNKTEKVATLNPETNEIEYKLPTEYQVYDAPEFMYKITTEEGEMIVSPDHKVYSSTVGKNNYWKLFGGIIFILIGILGLIKIIFDMRKNGGIIHKIDLNKVYKP